MTFLSPCRNCMTGLVKFRCQQLAWMSSSVGEEFLLFSWLTGEEAQCCLLPSLAWIRSVRGKLCKLQKEEEYCWDKSDPPHLWGRGHYLEKTLINPFPSASNFLLWSLYFRANLAGDPRDGSAGRSSPWRDNLFPFQPKLRNTIALSFLIEMEKMLPYQPIKNIASLSLINLHLEMHPGTWIKIWMRLFEVIHRFWFKILLFCLDLLLLGWVTLWRWCFNLVFTDPLSVKMNGNKV